MNKFLKLFLAVLIAVAPVLAQANNYAPSNQTTDAALTELFGGPSIVEDALCRAPVYVFASDHTGGVALWEWRVAARRVGSGSLTLVSTGTPIKSAAAALWTAVLAVTDDGTGVKANVTGGIGQTIDWLLTSDDTFCMVGPYAP